MRIKGKLVDIHMREIYSAAIDIEDGRIERITRTDDFESSYILPGFIDAHVHIESSMLSPGAFARASVPHGTIGVVSDPHEIANVIGPEGIEYM
ncbi:MAG TPA: amidohydrolase family protein, partial [Bacteroidales bacterium]|nr:amidohydrolase family protein [Bacteroidales bacterium]